MKNIKVKQGTSQKQQVRTALRILFFSGILLCFAFAIFFLIGNLGTPKRAMAGLAMHGAKVISSGTVTLNEFTYLTANASAGATSVTVNSSSLNANSRFSSNLSAGELVMIIQMQGATMTTSSSSSVTWGNVSAYNNSGKYEFGEVVSVPNSTTINLSCGLKNSYTSSGKVQVLRVPRYSTFSISSGATVSTDSWNGTTGGIIAIEANSTTTINGTLNVTGKGFRGGTVQQNSTCCPNGSNSSTYATSTSSAGGEKGEGIGGSTSTYDGIGGRYGRGAAANGGGGGNKHNASGGGGANGNNGVTWNGYGNPDTSTSSWISAWDLDGAVSNFHTNTSSGGGRGGYTYSSNNKSASTVAPGNSGWGGDYRSNVGGLGGRPLSNSGSRIFMGGGGGAGDSNDGWGTGGGNGGGIVYILTGSNLSGSGTINANGNDASTSVGSSTDGDGAGGGGGGGSVVIFTNSGTISNITINAKGGTGGSQTISFNEAEGAGGGGGGGYIYTTNATSLTRNINGGNNGTSGSPAVTEFTPNGGTKGASGLIATVPSNLYSCSTVGLPITLKSFTAEEKNNMVVLKWTTGAEINNDYFTIQKSDNGNPFLPIGTLKGAGNSTHEISYSFTDDHPSGDCFYILTQTDYDGKSETFPPVHIKMNIRDDSTYIVNTYPSPFIDRLKISYSSTSEEVVSFSIFNCSGKMVFSRQMFPKKGLNIISFDELSSMDHGLYFIVLTDATGQSFLKKAIKKS